MACLEKRLISDCKILTALEYLVVAFTPYMPRLAPGLINQAYREHYLLPLLLRSCRDLPSARRELRWLKDHAIKTTGHSNAPLDDSIWRHQLHKLCIKRSRGVPLQYLLGSEYFGDLEIICHPGVLIPRQETASIVSCLIDRLRHSGRCDFPKKIRMLDLCTGTGCIPLLFGHSFPYKELRVQKLEIVGVDASSKALSLARHNQQRILGSLMSETNAASTKDSTGDVHIESIRHMHFVHADILEDPDLGILSNLSGNLWRNDKISWDIVISNPPYISPKAFNTTTTRSVRNYEPKLALVPPAMHASSDDDQGDLFYPRLLEIADMVNAKILLVEVADLDQALRVAEMARQRERWAGVEVWRDEPGSHNRGTNTAPNGVRVIGRGNARAVFCCTLAGSDWICGSK